MKWVKYLEQFGQEDGEKGKIEPCVKVSLQVTAKGEGKGIAVQPDEQEVLRQLLKPIHYLHEQTQTISDLLSEIHGGKHAKIQITNSLLPWAKAHLSTIISLSFTPVRLFT